MKSRRQRREDQSAFVMSSGDRFHGILCSRPVRFDDESKAEMILTFFVIRRADGTYTVCNVNRTYDSKGRCVTRTVQNKDGIHADMVDFEVQAVRTAFSMGVERGSGVRLEWDWLDLGGVASMEEQVARIRAWGRVGARTEADLAKWN